MRQTKRILTAIVALFTGAALASSVPIPAPTQGCPPVVVKEYPHAKPVLVIEGDDEVIAVFCGHGPGLTITQGKKRLVVLYARCTTT